MRHWIKALGALAMMTSGCKAIELDPLASDSLQSELEIGASTGTGTAPGTPSAVAMRFSEWQSPMSDERGFTFPLPITPHPDALVLFFASRSQACETPMIQPEPGTGTEPAECAGEEAFWQAILVIPPDLANPGVVDLTDSLILGYKAYWISSCDDGGGGSVSGNGTPGTLEIVSIDKTSVSVKLNLDSSGWVSTSPALRPQNGDYTASFCP